MRAPQLRRTFAIALWLALGSCGGASGTSMRAPVEPVAAVQAPAALARPAIAAHTPLPKAPPPELTPAAAIEPPEDGWQAALRDGDLADRALEQRYPLHGVVFHVLGQVFEQPDTASFVIGVMRRGTTLRASAATAGRGCDSSWHELWTGGFVCRGRGFLLGKGPQTFTPAPAPAALYDTVPYQYAKNTAPSALQYFRIPSETELVEAKAAYAALAAIPKPIAVSPMLGTAADSASAKGEELPWSQLVRMEMAAGFYVSVDGTEQAGEREFARTVRGAFVDNAALSPVKLPGAAGGPLFRDEDLPLGIVYREGGKTMQRDPISGQLIAGEPLARYTRVDLLEGPSIARTDSRDTLRMTRSGQLIPEAKIRKLVRVARPALVPKGARWIHVHLAEQTLVAYEGNRAVYATLVASGKAGFETPMGLFRVHAKHVSATMDGLAGEEDAYSIEDVPWTLYFHGSYALHAAFWHDRFGNTRSHGCVNLAPADARWLFEWATPTLPPGFHGAMSTRENPGTYVLID